VSSKVEFDEIMRVRKYKGVRENDLYGKLLIEKKKEMEIDSIECEKDIEIEIKNDEKIKEEDGVYVKVDIMYK
jgi:hypothetical protein